MDKKSSREGVMQTERVTNPTLSAISSVPKPRSLASGIMASMQVVKIAASALGTAKCRAQEMGIKTRRTLSPELRKRNWYVSEQDPRGPQGRRQGTDKKT